MVYVAYTPRWRHVAPKPQNAAGGPDFIGRTGKTFSQRQILDWCDMSHLMTDRSGSKWREVAKGVAIVS